MHLSDRCPLPTALRALSLSSSSLFLSLSLSLLPCTCPSPARMNTSWEARRTSRREHFHMDGSDSSYVVLEKWWPYRHVTDSHHERVSEKLMSHKPSSDVSLEIATQSVAGGSLLVYAMREDGRRRWSAEISGGTEFYEIKRLGDALKMKYKRRICCLCQDDSDVVHKLQSTSVQQGRQQSSNVRQQQSINTSGYGVHVVGLLMSPPGVLIPKKWHLLELKVYPSKVELLVDGVIQVSKSDQQVCVNNRLPDGKHPPESAPEVWSQPKTFTIFIGGVPKLEALKRNKVKPFSFPGPMTSMYEPHFRGHVRNFSYVDFLQGSPSSRKIRASLIGRGVKIASGRTNKVDRGRESAGRIPSFDAVEEYDSCLVRNPCQNGGRCVGGGRLRTVKCDCTATFHHGPFCQEG